MNVTASAGVSVSEIVSVSVRLDCEREHERETQRAKNGMVWIVIPRNDTRIRTSL